MCFTGCSSSSTHTLFTMFYGPAIGRAPYEYMSMIFTTKNLTWEYKLYLNSILESYSFSNVFCQKLRGWWGLEMCWHFLRVFWCPIFRPLECIYRRVALRVWNESEFVSPPPTPRGHLLKSGDSLGHHYWGKDVLLASSKRRPGMVLHIV